MATSDHQPSRETSTSEVNIVEYGNQVAAGAPVVMSQCWDKFREGDVAALVVVGSGVSWSSLQIEFG